MAGLFFSTAVTVERTDSLRVKSNDVKTETEA